MNRTDIEKKYAIDSAEEKFFFEVVSPNGRVIAKINAPEQISSYIGDRLAEQEAKKAKKQWASWRVVNSKGRHFESGKRNKTWNATRELISQNIDSAEFENDAVVIRKVAKPDPEDAYITIMMPDGKLSDHTWNSVKKAMDFVIQGNYKGAKVVGFPSRKVLAK